MGRIDERTVRIEPTLCDGELLLGEDESGVQVVELLGVGGGAKVRFAQLVAHRRSEVGEPVRDLASRLDTRRAPPRTAIGLGQRPSLGGCRNVGTIAREDSFEYVPRLVVVAALGDDEDQVLLLPAGRADVQTATCRGCGRQLDADCDGV